MLQAQSRIVKGKRAKSSIPWQVHLCLDNSNNGEPNSCYCGGTILDEKTILVPSMSFYPNFIPIFSKFYADKLA
jgi:hypothetical protein